MVKGCEFGAVGSAVKVGESGSPQNDVTQQQNNPNRRKVSLKSSYCNPILFNIIFNIFTARLWLGVLNWDQFSKLRCEGGKKRGPK